MAQYKGLHVSSIVVSVRGSESECFLMDGGEIAEQIFGIFSFFIGIQFHLVNAYETKQGQLAVLVETGFCFELSVNEIGQEGRSQSLEQKLQVGLACGEQISGALPRWPAPLSETSDAPMVALNACLSGLPSLRRKSRTELKAPERLAGKAPV